MIEFKHLQEALAQYAKAIEDQYKTNLEQSGRRATGNLITSINTKVDVNGSLFEIELQLEDYWKYVEEGRGAGKFPPVDKILEWIRVKPILPYPDSRGKLPTEKQLAFLISRKISEVGTTGSHDLERTLQEIEYDWEERIMEALDQDIMDCFDSLFMVLEQ